MSLRRLTLMPLLAMLAALALLVSACGGSDGSSDKASASTRLAAALKQLDEAKAVTIDLSTAKLPRGTQGILKAEGTGTKAPAFTGSITAIQSGLSVKVPVRAVDGKVYIQFGGSWQTIDPADFGAPDPAALFASSGGLSNLLKDPTKVKAGRDTRDGKRVLSTIEATIPGDRVTGVIPSADSSESFAVVYTLDDDDTLVKATVRGAFYPDADKVTYTIRFSDYGKSVTVTAP